MALYSYRCPRCSETRIVSHTIAEHGDTPPPDCVSCTFNGDPTEMVRDYRTDKPQPAPMWPEHLNPTTGTVVRTRQQLQSDMDRGAADLFARTGVESRPVVIDRADMLSMRPDLA